MIDDKDPSEHIGEFKLDESDYSSSYKSKSTPLEPPTQEGPSHPSFLRNKYVIIIVVVLVLFVFYRFFAPSKKTISQQISPLSSAAQTQGQQKELLSARVTSLQQQVSDNTNSLNQLKAAISQLQATANGLRVMTETLSNSVQKNSQSMLQLLSRQRAAPLGEHRAKMIYHIRAIVPGRAWLESIDGSLLTVRPGSQLKTYGTITEIDAQQGIVRTDRGFVISYGRNDI